MTTNRAPIAFAPHYALKQPPAGLGREPGPATLLSDRARLRGLRSCTAAERLPASLRLAGRKKEWEARTILSWIGAPLATNKGEVIA